MAPRDAVSRTHDYRGAFGADGARIVRRRQIPEVRAERGTVVEDPASGFCGAGGAGRHPRGDAGGPALPAAGVPAAARAFLVDGLPATLVVPPRAAAGPVVSASGSVKVANLAARTARASRIGVEGIHDAALVNNGDDLRVEGVVVEPMHGMDDLAAVVADFGPAPHRRLGILVDHLVEGSKETRAAHAVAGPDVLVTGHPFVDVWQAVKPAVVGIRGGRPAVPRGTDWKTGVCAALGWASRPTGPGGCWCAATGTWRRR